MSRGGKRVGAGRPTELDGEGHRLSVSLDDTSGPGLIAYAQEHEITGAATIRELLAAWRESPAVRRAVATWRARRA